MTGVYTWSTTASENISANTGIVWDTGMAPVTVRTSSRQVMADIRTQWNDASWFQYGNGSKSVAATYASSTSVTIGGSVDSTAYWHAGRRVKAVGASTGTIYGKVSSSSYSAPNTTVNFTWDSGSLSNETLTLYASVIPVTGSPIAAESLKGAASLTTLTTSGAITGGGLLDISGASAGQVKFPASQNASADANTLDDYEEGTWTPVIAGSVTAGTQTYTNQIGLYTKVGRVVHFKVRITLSAFDGATAGNVLITGLPFSGNSTTNLRQAIAVGVWGGITLSAGYAGLGVNFSSTSNLNLIQVGSASAATNLTVAAMSSTVELQIDGSYIV